MGNTAAGRLTATYFGTAATVLGAAGGAESQTLTTAQLAPHSHNNTLTDLGHHHDIGRQVSFGSAGTLSIRLDAGVVPGDCSTTTVTTGITINNVNAGSGNPHPIVSPTKLTTIYLKL
jgi:hypothetical protein